MAKRMECMAHTLDTAFIRRLDLRVVSYRVTINGTTVEMDSPEEVYQLLAKSSADSSSRVSIEGNGARQDWTAFKATQFLNRLPANSLQRRVIRLLYHAKPDGVSKEDLLKELETTDSQQAGGVLSGLAKNAKKLGLTSPLEIEKTRDQTGRRTYIYRLHGDFRQLLERADKKEEPRRDLPELRDYIRIHRAALGGFMEQGARLKLIDDMLIVIPRSDIYVRYLRDNLGPISEFASKVYKRPISVQLLNPNQNTPEDTADESPTNEDYLNEDYLEEQAEEQG
jgi:hypothetical protein